MTLRSTSVGVVAFLLAGGTFLAQQEGNWQILAYPDPAPGVAATYCMGINESGDMAGYYVAPTSRAFLLAGGEYYSLLPTGATLSTAFGINARGDIVGNFTSGGVVHGFLLRRNTFILIDLDGPAMTHPRDINARGDIAGFYMTTTSSPGQGFVRDKNGDVTVVQYPGATSTTVLGINEQGDVAGEYVDASGTHGFVRTEDGEFTAIDYPGASTTSAQKIGANGTVFGWYYLGTGATRTSHGFVLRHGEFEQVDFPGAVQTMIHGGNNLGETCGMMSFTPAGTTPIVWGGFAHLW